MRTRLHTHGVLAIFLSIAALPSQAFACGPRNTEPLTRSLGTPVTCRPGGSGRINLRASMRCLGSPLEGTFTIQGRTHNVEGVIRDGNSYQITVGGTRFVCVEGN